MVGFSEKSRLNRLNQRGNGVLRVRTEGTKDLSGGGGSGRTDARLAVVDRTGFNAAALPTV
jgi:hypothetical protein